MEEKELSEVAYPKFAFLVKNGPLRRIRVSVLFFSVRRKGSLMAHYVEEKEGLYRIRRKGGLFGPRVRVLPNAVAAFSPAGPAVHSAFAGETMPNQEFPQYGWVRSLLPAPRKDDAYLVEFTSPDTFRIWGYADRYGRAFVTSRPLVAPPARDADIVLIMDSPEHKTGQPADSSNPRSRLHTRGAESVSGCVQLRDKQGVREVARFRRERGAYTLFDSWCDFGDNATGLAYDDALARCFFAFSFRPLLGGASIPARGLAGILERLDCDAPFAALIEVVHGIRQAAVDPAMRPPALALMLASWLDDVGAERVLAAAQPGKTGQPPLRLVRTVRYSNTFYIGKADPDTEFPEQDVWAIESALNRFLLIMDELGDHAALASADECGRIDAEMFADIAVQAPCAEHPVDEARPVAQRAGEWEIRRAIGEAMERFRLPVRLSSQFRLDVEAGIAAFEIDAPDSSFMPARVFDAKSATWRDASEKEREGSSLRYVECLGAMLAAAAFNAGAAVRSVEVVAYAARFDAAAEDAAPLYRVSFSREAFCGGSEPAYRTASDDPRLLFSACDALFGEDARSDRSIDDVVSARVRETRRDLPEVEAAELTARAKKAFCADSSRDLRIRADSQLRNVAERVAASVTRAASATEAIRCVQAEQGRADDPRVFEACTRLMTALIEDSVDSGDENALVTCFMGDDPYLIALGRARAVARTDAHAAAEVLREAIARAEASHRFDDNAEAVHRMFDSYASRILYNRERAGTATWTCGLIGPHPDEGKRVELLPTSLAMCYLDSVRLLEESFDHADEALELGKRCIQVAPTYSPAYRQTARAYMLVGDMANSARMLKRALDVATLPDEIAMAYYQLAYVEWKAGDSASGVACYLKSMIVSPIYLAQCTIEMHQLMAETGQGPIAREQVDAVLAGAGIPVSPSDVMLDALDDAMHCAIDANMFGVGSSLLALRLRYRPDDALMNVLQSLNAPLVPNTLD